MLTIQEAIDHAMEIASNPSKCIECRRDHLQLAQWLKELQLYQTQGGNQLVFL